MNWSYSLQYVLAKIALMAALLFLIGCGASDSAPTSGLSEHNAGGDPRQSDPNTPAQNPGTNVTLGGSQDFGFFRAQLEAGRIPTPDSLDAAGFFAEHHTELPPPSCGERICLVPMLAVMGNLLDGSNCTMLQLALNSPLSADPTERPPLSLAVVVDVSGSMQGEKIQFVREGLDLLLDGMKDGDQLAIISYADTASVVVPLSEVVDNRVALRTAIRGLQAQGSTNLWDGLEAGYSEIQRGFDPKRQNRVILLSDGRPTAGEVSPPAIVSMSAGHNSDGIGLTTIGLGQDFNAELMRDLALQADGNFYFLENAGAVDEVFTEELSFFTVPIAFDLDLKLTAGSEYRFGRALGSPFWVDSASGGGLSVPSAFIAHRESDDDVTDDDGRRGGGSALLIELMPDPEANGDIGPTVASIDFSFRDPITDRLVTDQVDVTYPYATTELRARGHFDAVDTSVVQKSFVMLNIFVGFEETVVDFYAQRADETTILRLDSLIAAVEDYNDEVQDKDIELDLEMLELLRVNLVRNGVPAETAPPFENPWPAD